MARDEEEKKSGFKVNDRRRFDAEGEDRKDRDVESTSSAESAQSPNFTNAGDKREAEASTPAEITFSAFVMSLATQALMQLGEMKPPPGVELPVDRAGAKNTIDILGLLEQKTKGNLDKEEDYMLHEIVHNLRIAFVQAAKK